MRVEAAGNPREPSRSIEGPGPGSDRDSALDGLERLREALHRGLDRLEAAVRARPLPAPAADPYESRREALEEARRQFRAEADRWELHRQARLEELDQERRLLAEAWERLEREQIEALASVRPGSGPGPGCRPVQSPRPTPPGVADARAEERPVSSSALRQFEELRRDVRRSSRSHRRG